MRLAFECTDMENLYSKMATNVNVPSFDSDVNIKLNQQNERYIT